VWAILGVAATIYTQSVISSHGTLIVAVPTRTGWLVCADKRTYDRVRGDKDDVTKLLGIGSAIFGSTGNADFYGLLTDRITGRESAGAILFSAEDVVNRFAATNAFSDTSSFWTGLMHELTTEFESFLRRIPSTWWPESGAPPDSALFQLPFFWVDSGSVPHGTLLRFHYKRQSPFSIEIRKHDLQAEKITDNIKVIAFGNIAVYEEIMNGKDKRFDDLRQDKEIRRLFFDKPARTTVTETEAEAFGRRFIVLTSERTHLIENTTFHVGPTADCVVIGKNIIRWIESH